MIWRKSYNITNPQLWLVLFCLLYSIWLVPDTLGMRYFCLVLGSVFGLYLFLKNKSIINLKNYWNILLIFSLFIIVIPHYFFNSEGVEAIRSEFSVIWKKTFLGVNFAIGLGLVLRVEKKSKYKNIFILSLALPVVIFFLISLFNNVDSLNFFNHLIVADYFNPFNKKYIAKYQYVFFAMPILGVSFYELKASLEGKTKVIKSLLVLSLLLIILSSFYLINGKNGLLYFIACFIFFTIGAMLKYDNSIRKILLMIILSIGVLLITRQYYLNDTTWRNLSSDIQIASETDKYNNWKYSTTVTVPNQNGQSVSETTYLRVAWLKEGLLMVMKYPMGYGLIQDSFKYLGRKEWPDASLSHTHWGWLDLTLGLGVPGFLILLSAVFNAFDKCRRSQNYYAKTGVWVLPLLSFAFLTSEVCEKTSWDMFLFMISFYSVVSIEDE